METQTLEVPKTGTKLGLNENVYVLEAHRAENGNIYVLLLIPHSFQPFCVGLYVGQGSWHNGHYFDNVNEALYDYMERT